MTPVFTCGFECGQAGSVGQHWGTFTSVNFSTTIVRSGARSLRANPTGVSTLAFINSSIISSSIAVARCYVYFATLPNAEIGLLTCREGSGEIGGAYFESTDNKIYARGGAGGLGATGISVTTGQWYRIDLKFDASANPRLIDVQVDGSACGQRSDSFAATTIVNISLLSSSVGWTGDVYADDLLISATSADYPIGAGYVNHFVPSADGTHNIAGANDFERSATGTDITNATTDAYTLIDDVPMKSGVPTEYINMIAPPNATDYVEVVFGPAPGISTPTTAPRCVNATFSIAQTTTGTNNHHIALNDNGTTNDVFNANSGAGNSIQFKFKNYALAPTGGAWTVVSGAGNFNNIRARFSTSDAAPDPWVASAMIEAEFAEVITRIPRPTSVGHPFII